MLFLELITQFDNEIKQLLLIQGPFVTTGGNSRVSNDNRESSAFSVGGFVGQLWTLKFWQHCFGVHKKSFSI